MVRVRLDTYSKSTSIGSVLHTPGRFRTSHNALRGSDRTCSKVIFEPVASGSIPPPKSSIFKSRGTAETRVQTCTPDGRDSDLGMSVSSWTAFSWIKRTTSCTEVQPSGVKLLACGSVSPRGAIRLSRRRKSRKIPLSPTLKSALTRNSVTPAPVPGKRSGCMYPGGSPYPQQTSS